jgi:predicted NBD/HSP70 family sugar kinase
VQGVGIAAPLEPGRLASLLGCRPSGGRWQRWTCAQGGPPDDLPVTLIKDTAAACVAELVAGAGAA